LSNLAIMLQRAGLLPEGEAARIRELAYANRVPLVEVIVERGLATEDQLVKFLQSKLMIPEVEADLLDELERETLRHLPADLAWYHEVLPVSVDDVGNLTLAMADPTDLRAVDAVAGHTGAYLVRAVAPLSALRRALERYYGPRPDDLRARIAADAQEGPAATVLAPPPAAAAAPSVVEEPEPAPAAPPSPPPPSTPPPTRVGVSTVRRELLPPISDDAVPPLSPTAFARLLPRLVAAADRDEITQVLLDFLSEGFSRVIMFVHLQQQLRGRDARGDDLLLEAVTQVRIPTSGPSLFRDVIERGAPHFGPWRTDSKINAAFDQAMGGIRGNVLVLPVKLRERVPLLVYASNTPHPVDPRSLHELVDGISGALERLIFRRKSQDTLPRIG
jgi:Type II secretion system (T2SS), protein E, N-terminal domain